MLNQPLGQTPLIYTFYPVKASYRCSQIIL